MKLVIEKLRPYEEGFDEDYKARFLNSERTNTQLLTKYPTVYIHNWKNKNKSKYNVYVGETNDIYKRTMQHKEKSENDGTWQKESKDNNDVMYVIGHDHFNKSLTLDVENKLMEYMSCVENVDEVKNLQYNPQREYYPCEELDEIFASIWQELNKNDKNLFPDESKIKESALYKASPLKKLTDTQEEVQNLIIDRVIETLKATKNDEHRLIFVEGTAGTGKTVLTSSTFYRLACLDHDEESELYKYTKGNLESCLIVNHNQQLLVYEQIVKKLGLSKNNPVVYKPTSFILGRSKNKPVDVAFIDEGHLLLTQNVQAYSKDYDKLQLKEIIERAKVTVIMFDENQVLKSQQYWDSNIINYYKEKALLDGNYFKLEEQLRMHINNDSNIENWINDFTLNHKLENIPASNNYEIKVFDNPVDLSLAIEAKSKEEEYRLSRLVATYDWDYKQDKEKAKDELWQVDMPEFNFHMPWNYELTRNCSKNELKDLDGLTWSEQPQTINEVGSTFSIQGFDLNYVGVILGPSVKYRDGKIIYDPTQTKNTKVTNRKLEEGVIIDPREKLIENEVRVLMTRGVNGLYIFACDQELREALLKAGGN